jgi:hypothetical protein
MAKTFLLPPQAPSTQQAAHKDLEKSIRAATRLV